MKSNKTVVIISLIGVGVCILALFSLTTPYFIDYWGSAEKSNVGSVIGGITAPIIGLVSIILLYLALTKQTQSNNEQQLKNESDFLFLLINQLDNEVSSFYFKYNQGGVEKKWVGLEGLHRFSHEYSYEWDFPPDDPITFKAQYEAGQILLITESYNLIKNRIDNSNLSDKLHDVFSKKLLIYFECKLKIPLTELFGAFEKFPNQKDDYTEAIQEFVLKYCPNVHELLADIESTKEPKV